jgi:hypothetical protein
MPMMGRHGAGSIVKRKHGPPYHATLIVGGRRLFRYAQTVKEAERALTELRRMRDNDLDPTRQTVADFLRSWMAGLRDAKRQRVRPRTLEHYELIVERHIIPALGKHRLSVCGNTTSSLGWMRRRQRAPDNSPPSGGAPKGTQCRCPPSFIDGTQRWESIFQKQLTRALGLSPSKTPKPSSEQP